MKPVKQMGNDLAVEHFDLADRDSITNALHQVVRASLPEAEVTVLGDGGFELCIKLILVLEQSSFPLCVLGG